MARANQNRRSLAPEKQAVTGDLHADDNVAAHADADGSRRGETTPRGPVSRASFIMLWTAAVVATAAAFIVHLSMRYQTIDLGYEVGAERREQRRLIEERRLLSLEAATLRQAPRIEAVARGVLEMDQPNAARIVPVVPQEEQRQTAGGVR